MDVVEKICGVAAVGEAERLPATGSTVLEKQQIMQSDSASIFSSSWWFVVLLPTSKKSKPGCQQCPSDRLQDTADSGSSWQSNAHDMPAEEFTTNFFRLCSLSTVIASYCSYVATAYCSSTILRQRCPVEKLIARIGASIVDHPFREPTMFQAIN